VDYSSFVVVSDGERGVDVVDVVDDKGVVERPRMEQQRMEQQRRMEPSPSSLQVDEPDSASKNSTANDNDTNNNNFWKARYFAEERDATRTNISATELESLVFDFRFWIGQPTVTVDGHIVVKSGLLESASREVRFTNSTPIVMDGDGDDDNGGGDDGMENSDESREEFPGGMWSARGHLMGHPCREPGIECEYRVFFFRCRFLYDIFVFPFFGNVRVRESLYIFYEMILRIAKTFVFLHRVPR